MFIYTEKEANNKMNKEFVVINSEIIKEISASVNVSKPNDDDKYEKFTYTIYFKDYDNNMYELSTCDSIVNTLELSVPGLEVRVLSVIEKLLNSDKDLQESFIDAVTNELILLLNKKF